MEREHEHESTSALLAALYGAGGASGGDGDSEPEATAELPAALAGELAAFREVRAMFEGLPELEPPVEMNAQLIRAAAEAVRAHSKADRVSLWDRALAWFEPLRAHPALAALASLILVASIGGVLYVGGKAKLAEPGAEMNDYSSASNLERQARDGESGESDESGGSDPADETRDRRANDPALEAGDQLKTPSESVGIVRSEGASGTVATKRRSPPSDIPVNNSSNNSSNNSINNPSNKKSGSKNNAVEGEVGQTIVLGKGDADRGGTEGPKDKQVRGGDSPGPGSAPEPKPAPPPVQEPTRPTEEKPKAPSKTELASLRSKARSFAKKSDCDQVRKVGEQVRDLDDGYFDSTFLADALIAPCYRAK